METDAEAARTRMLTPRFFSFEKTKQGSQRGPYALAPRPFQFIGFREIRVQLVDLH
jgi:hypothetical protein